MKAYRLAAPPATVQRATLDNVALVPASLLPFKDEWQALANQLPDGTTLIILPRTDSGCRHVLEIVVTQLRAKGRHVTTLPAESLAGV